MAFAQHFPRCNRKKYYKQATTTKKNRKEEKKSSLEQNYAHMLRDKRRERQIVMDLDQRIGYTWFMVVERSKTISDRSIARKWDTV